MKVKDIAITLFLVAVSMAIINHLWNTLAEPLTGSTAGQPQVIYVPVQVTAPGVVEVAPAGMAAPAIPTQVGTGAVPVPVETWAGAEATAEVITIQPAVGQVVPDESCKVLQNCPTVKNK